MVQPLFFRWQQGEITLSRWRHRLDNVFQWITIDAVEQVKHKGSYFGIGQEQGMHVALGQVGADRCIVGKIAVMHQGFMHADKWVGTARMPHFSLSWIAMVPDPDVGTQIFQSVIAKDIIPITNHLKHKQVFSMRQNESSFVTGSSVIGTIQTVGVLIDDLILDGRAVCICDLMLLQEIGLHVRADAALEIAVARQHRGGHDAVVVDRF